MGLERLRESKLVQAGATALALLTVPATAGAKVLNLVPRLPAENSVEWKGAYRVDNPERLSYDIRDVRGNVSGNVRQVLSVTTTPNRPIRVAFTCPSPEQYPGWAPRTTQPKAGRAQVIMNLEAANRTGNNGLFTAWVTAPSVNGQTLTGRIECEGPDGDSHALDLAVLARDEISGASYIPAPGFFSYPSHESFPGEGGDTEDGNKTEVKIETGVASPQVGATVAVTADPLAGSDSRFGHFDAGVEVLYRKVEETGIAPGGEEVTTETDTLDGFVKVGWIPRIANWIRGRVNIGIGICHALANPNSNVGTAGDTAACVRGQIGVELGNDEFFGFVGAGGVSSTSEPHQYTEGNANLGVRF